MKYLKLILLVSTSLIIISCARHTSGHAAVSGGVAISSDGHYDNDYHKGENYNHGNSYNKGKSKGCPPGLAKQGRCY